MPLSVSICFDGNCREAVTFYASVFGQEVPRFLTYAEMDTSYDENVSISEEGKNRVVHTSLMIADTMIECNDMPDHFEFIRGNSLFLTVSMPDIEKAKAVFTHLGENGQVFVPFADIPGQGWYGMLGDRFGLGWIIRAV